MSVTPAAIQMRVPAGRPIIATTRESPAAVCLATSHHECEGMPARTQSRRHSRATHLHWVSSQEQACRERYSPATILGARYRLPALCVPATSADHMHLQDIADAT